MNSLVLSRNSAPSFLSYLDFFQKIRIYEGFLNFVSKEFGIIDTFGILKVGLKLFVCAFIMLSIK